MTKTKDPLVGKYFHSVGTDRETISWQGQIIARAGDSYLLQLFEWFTGSESNQTLVPAAEMDHWLFDDSPEAMNCFYDSYRRRQEVKERLEQQTAAAETQEAR
jgi:hypothetical protein